MQHHVAFSFRDLCWLQAGNKATQDAWCCCSAEDAPASIAQPAGGEAGFVEARSYPPRGVTSPQASPPSPRSQPLAQQVSSSFGVFFREERHTPFRCTRGDQSPRRRGGGLRPRGLIACYASGAVLEKTRPLRWRGLQLQGLLASQDRGTA